MTAPAALSRAEAYGLIAALEREEVATFADLRGSAPDLAAAAHATHDCALICVDLTEDARLTGETSPRATDWVRRLLAQGVPERALRIVTRPREVRPVDVAVSLEGFGAAHRIKPLARILPRLLGPESRLLIDLRKGSGGFPFLRDYGSTTTLAEIRWQGTVTNRVLLRAEPQAVAPVAESWGRVARDLAGDGGFYRSEGPHGLVFVPRGDTLVVTFDNLDIAMTKRADQRPWGWSWVEARGWSALGVTAAGWTWFRDPWVSAEFDRLAAEGFFRRFGRVVFYGASMGGYGALAFSAAAPGADVVAFSPQTTLDRAKVPWEERYRVAWDRDWSDRYGDAAATVAAARRVHLFYDPYSAPDAAHIARLSGDHLRHHRFPFLGHRLGSALAQMGALSGLVEAAFEDRLDAAARRAAFRARRGFPRYQRELLTRAIAAGHPRIAARAADRILAERDDPALARLRQGL